MPDIRPPPESCVTQIITIFVVRTNPYRILRRRIPIACLLLLVSSAASSLTAFSQRIVRTGSEITHGLISEESLESRIRFLTDSICGGRGCGTSGSVEAGMWIGRQFGKAGAVPMGEGWFRSFRADNGTVCRNVIGLIPSTGQTPGRRYLIIAAHYDGHGFLDGKMYPGADSNASGVAAMLGLGEMISAMVSYGKTYSQNIILVGLDAKNLSMGGAGHLWGMIRDGGLRDPVHGNVIKPSDISMMVNIDQIGSSLSPVHPERGDYLIMLSDGRSDYYRAALRAADAKAGTGMDLAFDYYGSRSFTDMFYRRVSDQKVFLENGVNAVMFTSGITMNNNKTWDTVDSLDMTLLMHRIWIMFHWIERII